jgi:D-sedoheptulose 7-phosphate isomerase
MTDLNPKKYFSKIGSLLAEATATDSNNKPLALEQGLTQALELITAADRKVIMIGNGGSAAIASHIYNDLVHSLGIKALIFNDASLMTAISNDDGYEAVYQKPIELWAEPNVLLWAISSSGESENILRAVRAAKMKGASVLTFSGFNPDNALRKTGDLNLYVDSKGYGEVEIAHMNLGHYVTDCVLAQKSKAGKARS